MLLQCVLAIHAKEQMLQQTLRRLLRLFVARKVEEETENGLEMAVGDVCNFVSETSEQICSK